MTVAGQQQRPLRGSRISTFYPVKNLPSLASLDSAFQLQEYISLLIRLDVHDVDAIVSVPGGSAKQKEKQKEADGAEDGRERKAEVTVDEACWKYEQLRRLAQDLSHPLITMLQQECTRATCPEMKAGEWLYLCVAHGNDGAMEQCCAIDYILHTLDSATALLNSPRAFPSRLQVPPTSHRHFSSLARRLGRIFAHAYFHHREAFEQAEAESSLYARFLALTDKFDLVPAEFLVIPPRTTPSAARDVPPPTLLGASLHVETQQDDGAREGTTQHQRGQSASPPGLEDGVSPRRYGRNRTDTMMHEGEGKFPQSPAMQHVSLDEALAEAEGAVRRDVAPEGARKEGGCASKDSESSSKDGESSGQEGDGARKDAETASTYADAVRKDAATDTTRTEAHTDAEPAAPTPPSPTSSDEEEPEQQQPTAHRRVVTPSSSTAPQAEGPIDMDVEQGREESPAHGEEGQSGVTESAREDVQQPLADTHAAAVEADVALPDATVEPATSEEPAPEPVVEDAVTAPEVAVVESAAELQEEPAQSEPTPEIPQATQEQDGPAPTETKDEAEEEVDVTDSKTETTDADAALPVSDSAPPEIVVEQKAEEEQEGGKTAEVNADADAEKSAAP
ncbi:Mob1/phocein [Mycena rebaudengoi]|nr:Mob1/phocein [Mycena rebaudengoi]